MKITKICDWTYNLIWYTVVYVGLRCIGEVTVGVEGHDLVVEVDHQEEDQVDPEADQDQPSTEGVTEGIKLIPLYTLLSFYSHHVVITYTVVALFGWHLYMQNTVVKL